MKTILKVLLVSLLAAPSASHAQNISGVWEGIMDDEFLQVNVEQKGNELCGYTYDYILRNRDNHCRATFTGNYNATKKEWTLSGIGFLENYGNHSLMRIRMRMEPGSSDTLWIKVAPKGFLASMMGIVSIETYLLKTSSSTNFRGWIPPCFPKPKDKPVVQPKDTLKSPQVVIPEKKEIKKDTVVAPIAVVPVPRDSAGLAKDMSVRKQTEQSRLVINTDHINLKLYDNGVVDNDTISVFYNGRLLVSHQRLSEKAVEIHIDLDKNTSIHEITLYAENLGGIPPNTALIVVTAGDKRYELRSKASLEENALLIFEYKPIKN